MHLPQPIFIICLFVLTLFSFRNSIDGKEQKPYVSAKIDSTVKTNWNASPSGAPVVLEIYTSTTISNPSPDTVYYTYSICGQSCKCNNGELFVNWGGCDTIGIETEEIDPGKYISTRECMLSSKKPKDLKTNTFKLGFILVTKKDLNIKDDYGHFAAFRKVVNDSSKVFWSNEIKTK
jgi:hypothetical protein